MPRPKAPIWKFFDEMPDRRAVCRYCGKDLGAQPERMAVHLVKSCPSSPQNAIAAAKTYYPFLGSNTPKKRFRAGDEIRDAYVSEDEFEDRAVRPRPVETLSFKPNKASASTQLKINFDAPRTQALKSEENEALQEMFAGCVFRSGLPLAVFEADHWTEFFSKVNSQFKKPTTESLSEKHLPTVHEKVANEVQTCLSNPVGGVTLMTDGWYRSEQATVINFVATAPKPLFVQAVDTTTLEDRAEGKALATLFKKIVDDFGGPCSFEGKGKDSGVAAILTRGEASSTESLPHVKKVIDDAYPTILVLPCLADSMQTLFKDICSSQRIADVIKRADAVAKYFVQQPYPAGLLRKMRKKMGVVTLLKVAILDENNWRHLQKTLASLRDLKPCLREIGNMKKERLLEPPNRGGRNRNEDLSGGGAFEWDDSIIDAITDSNFWLDIAAVIELLRPVADAIMFCNMEDPRIDQVARLVHQLKSHLAVSSWAYKFATELGEEEIQDVQKWADRTLSDVIRHPVYWLADILNPRSRGSFITASQWQEGIDSIASLISDKNAVDSIIELVEQYHPGMSQQSGLFAHSFLWRALEKDEKSPQSFEWWERLPAPVARECQLLQRFAVKLLTIPASSVATERCLHTFHHMHRKSKNGTSLENSIKLAYIYENHRNLRRFEGMQTSGTADAKGRREEFDIIVTNEDGVEEDIQQGFEHRTLNKDSREAAV